MKEQKSDMKVSINCKVFHVERAILQCYCFVGESAVIVSALC